MAGAELARSATEQPDVDMDSSLAVPASVGLAVPPPGPTGSATEQTSPATDSSLAVPAGPTVSIGPQSKWEIQVSFKNDMWWAMPQELSDSILEQWTHGAQQVSFIWDWGTSRLGSYQPGGAQTSINRYIIDFDTMYQRNVDNGRTRKAKVVCILR